MNLDLPLYNLFHINKQWNENLIFEGRLIIWYAKKLLTFLKTNDTSLHVSDSFINTAIRPTPEIA